MLWLIDEGGYFSGVKLFDNFYGLQSIIDFSVVQSEDILGDTLILRVSNIIGFRNKNKRMVHFTFLDHFLKNINQNKVIFTKNIYKDFLSISQFVNIIYMLIKKNAYGVINVSLGKKIYVRDLVNWLNFYNPNKLEYIYNNKGINFDCFTLNNDKLKKLINYKVLKSDLRKDCIMISKKIFQKK
jgi:nucleoside-diphosphate-sugar epimerase